MQSVYLKLPRVFQNLSLSALGYKLYRERFGLLPDEYRDLGDIVTPASRSQFELQRHRLQRLLAYCRDYVPYYHPYLKNVDLAGINAESLVDILPVIDKQLVLSRQDEFITRHPEDKKKLLQLNTSGSSGTPLKVLATPESRRINYAFYQQMLFHFGCTYRSRSTTFAGRILFENLNAGPDRYDYFCNTQYLSSYFISRDSVSAYLRALDAWRPEFIDSYPSALLSLIVAAQKEGVGIHFSPKFILTSSETLSAEARVTIETFFGAPVIDHYGCTEMVISASSLGGGYVVSPLYCVVELEPAFDDYCSVITTGLLNFGMPLLRYKIGDLVQNLDSNYQFAQIVGRTDDVIVTADGRQIGRMDPVFKGIEGVAESQIIQARLDCLRVLIVLDAQSQLGFDESLLIENIKLRTSLDMDVLIEYVGSIPRGRNGKFKSVISLLNSDDKSLGGNNPGC